MTPLDDRDYLVLAKLSLARTKWFATYDKAERKSLATLYRRGYAERSLRPYRYRITSRGVVLLQLWRSYKKLAA